MNFHRNLPYQVVHVQDESDGRLPNSVGQFKLCAHQVLGTGTFAVVYKGYCTLTRAPVAIKVINKAKIESLTLLYREVNLVRKLNHPFIVKFYLFAEDSCRFYVVMEHVDGQELFMHIKNTLSCGRFPTNNEDNVRRLFRKILCTIYYMHQNGVVHRDIKPENLLIVGNDVKLIDFGLGNEFHSDERLNSFCGSINYVAPEVLQRKDYAPEPVDVWSLTIVLYAMLTGNMPFKGRNTAAIELSLKSKLYLKVEKRLSDEVKDLLDKCLQFDPDKRLGIKEIAAHPWVNIGYRYNCLDFFKVTLCNDGDINMVVFDETMKVLQAHSPSSSPQSIAALRDEVALDVSSKNLSAKHATYMLIEKVLNDKGYAVSMWSPRERRGVFPMNVSQSGPAAYLTQSDPLTLHSKPLPRENWESENAPYDYEETVDEIIGHENLDALCNMLNTSGVQTVPTTPGNSPDKSRQIQRVNSTHTSDFNEHLRPEKFFSGGAGRGVAVNDVSHKLEQWKQRNGNSGRADTVWDRLNKSISPVLRRPQPQRAFTAQRGREHSRSPNHRHTRTSPFPPNGSSP
eukprot:GCRY01000357.1.p1 GENE.GCRY01000357.1~~GCRY01000357.1.p1  ORF type:complete len:568 (+),score=120.86 GCRY01000357.1:462-2165(+)